MVDGHGRGISQILENGVGMPGSPEVTVDFRPQSFHPNQGRGGINPLVRSDGNGFPAAGTGPVDGSRWSENLGSQCLEVINADVKLCPFSCRCLQLGENLLRQDKRF